MINLGVRAICFLFRVLDPYRIFSCKYKAREELIFGLAETRLREDVHAASGHNNYETNSMKL